MSRSGISNKTERELAEFVSQFAFDPYGFVLAVFPWGVKGSALEHKKGPEPWQRELLEDLGAHMRENKDRKDIDLDYLCFRSVVASGHGIGKSAIVAWLIYFIMSTRPDARGVVTANTGNQLETKTWPELAKWHAMAINRHWFTWTAQTFYFSAYPPDRQKNYMVQATTVSAENTEAFAGLHNEGSAVFVIFDEASGIDPKVWEVADGALTDGEPFFFAFGNPTRPDGAFHDCFEKHRGMYRVRHIDSRQVSHTNKTVIADIIKKYGEDSDEAKVRVYGQFPSKSYDGFLSLPVVHEATQRELHYDAGAPLILGVDVARYGDDETVLYPRQGRDARSGGMLTFKSKSSHEIAEIVAKWALKFKPDGICIESVGPGVGVIDTLRAWKFKVIDVHPGAPSANPSFANVRMEMWDDLLEWFTLTGGCIMEDVELTKQLTSIRYLITPNGKQQMEAKKDMKERGVGSPDRADALALTFRGKHIARRDQAARKAAVNNSAESMDYDPLTY